MVTVEATGRYEVQRDPQMVFDLAAARSPEEIAAFAEAYGLLRHSSRVGEVRQEALSEWTQAIGGVTMVIDLYIHLRKAVDGDVHSVEFLRSVHDRIVETSSFYAARPGDTDQVFQNMSYVIGEQLNLGRRGVRSVVDSNLDVDDLPDTFTRWRFVMASTTLLSTIYDVLAELIVERRDMRHCEECARPFLVTDPRRLFHNEACAYRARRRRMLEKRKRETTTAIDGAGESV